MFTVNPGRTARYTLTQDDYEIKSIVARDLLRVFLVDPDPNNSAEVELSYNETRIGTSVIVGHNLALAFENTDTNTKVGDIGAVKQP